MATFNDNEETHPDLATTSPVWIKVSGCAWGGREHADAAEAMRLASSAPMGAVICRLVDGAELYERAADGSWTQLCDAAAA